MGVILYETTTQKYYFPWVVNLVKEYLEYYSDGSETIVIIVRMDIEMSVSEVGFRNSYHTRSMIRLTICFTVRNSKRQTVYNSIDVILYKLRSRKCIKLYSSGQTEGAANDIFMGKSEYIEYCIL